MSILGSFVGANPKCSSTSRVLTELEYWQSESDLFTHRRDSLGGRLAVSRTQSSTSYPLSEDHFLCALGVVADKL